MKCRGKDILLSTTRSREELQEVILRSRKLSDPKRQTSFKELKQLRQDALDALSLAGLDGTHFFEEVKGLDFYNIVYRDQGAALAAAPSVRRRLEEYAEEASNQKLPEHIQRDLYRQLERLTKVLELADRKTVQPQDDLHKVPRGSQALEPRDRRRAAKASTLPGSRRRNRFTPASPLAHRATSVRRVRTIAKLLGELDTLKPEMNTEEDYSRLAQTNKKFLCFRIAWNHPALRTKLENLQDHRQHVRLALELAAARHGVTLATTQTDWKRLKPSSFRKH